MNPFTAIARCGVACVASALLLGAASGEEAWMPLFNGKDLAGWVQRGGKARYRSENGEVIGTAVPSTGNSFLCTERSFTNFVLELEFKPMTGLNSGVQVRSECFDHPTTFDNHGKVVKIPAGRVHGYQVEIDPSPRAWTGGLYDEARRGWLQNLEKNEPARKAFKANQWNSFRIECRGDSFKTLLNGVPAADFHDALTLSGLIALQVHSVGTNSAPLEIHWRNVRIQELP